MDTVSRHLTLYVPLLTILAMTGTNFLNTPDGRPGWGDFFLSQGYEVRSGAIHQFTQ